MAFLALAPIAALAGQPDRPIDLSIAGLPPGAETGKPPTGAAANLALPKPDRCTPALPCGARLLGTVRKNGAVELQVPALRW